MKRGNLFGANCLIRVSLGLRKYNQPKKKVCLKTHLGCTLYLCRVATKENMLASSDMVVVSCALTADTQGACLTELLAGVRPLKSLLFISVIQTSRKPCAITPHRNVRSEGLSADEARRRFHKHSQASKT